MLKKIIVLMLLLSGISEAQIAGTVFMTKKDRDNITNLQDRVSKVEILSGTNQVTRWYSNSTNWLEYNGGNVISSLYVSGGSTNGTTLYLGTNVPLYAETWSFIDMTNWMEVGNSGYSWVTGIVGTAISSEAALRVEGTNVLTGMILDHSTNLVIHVTEQDKTNWYAFGPRISGLEIRSNDWNTAFSWGNHAIQGYAYSNLYFTKTESDSRFVNFSHTNDFNNPHRVTAAQVGSLTASQSSNLVSSAISNVNFLVDNYGNSILTVSNSTGMIITQVPFNNWVLKMNTSVYGITVGNHYGINMPSDFYLTENDQMMTDLPADYKVYALYISGFPDGTNRYEVYVYNAGNATDYYLRSDPTKSEFMTNTVINMMDFETHAYVGELTFAATAPSNIVFLTDGQLGKNILTNGQDGVTFGSVTVTDKIVSSANGMDVKVTPSYVGERVFSIQNRLTDAELMGITRYSDSNVQLTMLGNGMLQQSGIYSIWGNYPSSVTLFRSGDSINTLAMRGGNVGLGYSEYESIPEKLSVRGNETVFGNITSSGTNFATYFSKNGSMVPSIADGALTNGYKAVNFDSLNVSGDFRALRVGLAGYDARYLGINPRSDDGIEIYAGGGYPSLYITGNHSVYVPNNLIVSNNFTTVGTNTAFDFVIDDDLGTSGFYTVASIYKSVIQASTNVIVNANQSIYKINLDVASSINNDLSGLDFNGQGVEYKLGVNIREWAATGTTFNTKFDVQNGPVEFTVTGLYWFVCSSLDGQTIQIKQTYPTVYEWVKNIGISDLGTNEPRNGHEYVLMQSGDITNFFQVCVPQKNDLIVDMRVFIYYLDRDQSFEISYARTELSSYYTIQNPITNTVPSANSSVGLGYTKTRMFLPKVVENYSELGLKIVVMRPAAMNGVWQFFTPMVRRANELEIKAYNAGWKP